MAYFGASINEQPVLAELAGAQIESGAGKAVKYDTDGNVVLAGADEAICGVLIMQTEETVLAGDIVTVQFKDIGIVAAGGEIKKGDALSVDANGAFVKASDGEAVARALENGTEGTFIRAHICVVPTVTVEETNEEDDI